jgi:hypothetical protein
MLAPIGLFAQSAFNACKPLVSTFFLAQTRGYKKHMGDCNLAPPAGRSFAVEGRGKFGSTNPNRAYFALKKLIQEGRIRETVKLQSRFESNPKKRRRKAKEAQWRTYYDEVQARVRKGLHMRQRNEEERRALNYKEDY